MPYLTALLMLMPYSAQDLRAHSLSRATILSRARGHSFLRAINTQSTMSVTIPELLVAGYLGAVSQQSEFVVAARDFTFVGETATI